MNELENQIQELRKLLKENENIWGEERKQSLRNYIKLLKSRL